MATWQEGARHGVGLLVCLSGNTGVMAGHDTLITIYMVDLSSLYLPKNFDLNNNAGPSSRTACLVSSQPEC